MWDYWATWSFKQVTATLLLLGVGANSGLG